MDSRLARRRRAALWPLLLAFLIATPGCQWVKSSVEEWWAPTRDGNPLDTKLTESVGDKQPDSDQPPDGDSPSNSARGKSPPNPSSATPPAQAAGQTALDPALRAALGKDSWALNVALPGAEQLAGTYRWRSPAIDPILRLPPAERPDLTPSLADPDLITAANAAIILARWGQGDPTERLVATARSELRLPVRRAAIEALGHVGSPASAAALEKLLQQYGQFAGPAARAYVSELHADLLIALAQRSGGDSRPAWTAALKSPDAMVRVVALECWAGSNASGLPPVALELRGDNDIRVRIALLKALGRRRDPRAYEVLRHALDDFDLSVRLAAIGALGDLGTAEARGSLEKLRQNPGEVLRAAAIEALAACKADAAVAAAVGDKSWRVRLAVANALRQDPEMVVRSPRQAERLSLTLVADKNVQVQQAALAAVQGWPLEQAGPALLLALRDGGFQVRRTAAAQLSERWPPAADFPLDGSAEARLTAVERLQGKWQAQFGLQQFQLPDTSEAPRATLARLEALFRRQVAAVDSAAPEPQPAAELDAADVERLRGLVAQLNQPELPKEQRRAAVQALRELGPAVIPPLEQMAVDEGQRLPDEVFNEALPPLDSAFAALEQLGASDAHRRWAAADKLAQLAAEHSLSPLAIDRLATQMARQKEPLVWQPIMTVVARDAREPAMRIVYMAVTNESAEVRRRACEYLELHPAPAHAATLIPLLDDPHTAVVAAAARALGAGGGLEDPAPLVALLTRPDKRVRLEAASALVRLGSSEGVAALERLAADADADVRRSTATAMGQLPDPVFIPTLMTLLEDRHDVARAALDSLAAVAGKDVSAARPEDESPPTVAERIHRWQQWYAETR